MKLSKLLNLKPDRPSWVGNFIPGQNLFFILMVISVFLSLILYYMNMVVGFLFILELVCHFSFIDKKSVRALHTNTFNSHSSYKC